MAVRRWKSRFTSLAGKPVERVVQGLDNQSKLLDAKLGALVEGVKNQSQLLNLKLETVIQGLNNESRLLDSRFEQTIVGIDNLAQLLNNRMEQIIHGRSERAPGPVAQVGVRSSAPPACQKVEPVIPVFSPTMNDLAAYSDVFAGITPWAGKVPSGYLVDFLGTLTSAEFRVMFGVDPKSVGGREVKTAAPTIGDGEGWFEAVNWVIAAREARSSYVMVTLGACYGAQLSAVIVRWR